MKRRPEQSAAFSLSRIFQGVLQLMKIKHEEHKMIRHYTVRIFAKRNGLECPECNYEFLETLFQ